MVGDSLDQDPGDEEEDSNDDGEEPENTEKRKKGKRTAGGKAKGKAKAKGKPLAKPPAKPKAAVAKRPSAHAGNAAWEVDIGKLVFKGTSKWPSIKCMGSIIYSEPHQMRFRVVLVRGTERQFSYSWRAPRAAWSALVTCLREHHQG